MIEVSDEAEMPGQPRFRLRFPDNTRIGPFPAKTLTDLYSGGGVPDGAFVRREPDGAWLPFLTAFRNVTPPRKKRSGRGTVPERRLNREFAVIERRRGKSWMFGEIALFASLAVALLLALH